LAGAIKHLSGCRLSKCMNPIPKSITVNTGEQHSLTKTIDDFFVETKEFAQQTYGLLESGFQIRSGELAYHSHQITNDRVTYLAYMDVVLASVFETRTEFNYVKYTFFRNEAGFGELVRKKKGI
jgi:hypothetical protein